jgi:heavy metal sensor kinase
VLDARNTAFVERKAAELLAGAAVDREGGTAELEAEIRREVLAHEPEGLIVVVRRPGGLSVNPDTAAARHLAERPVPPRSPVTLELGEPRARHLVLVATPQTGTLTLELGISLAETEATLAAFDRVAGAGALAFLFLAVVGGMFLSRQALRPVTASIRAARSLDPENLDGRLPLTGAGDELDQLASTINGLLDRLTAYHDQIIRLTADASHELRSPLAAMRAAVEVSLQKPRGPEEYRNTLASIGEQCERLTSLVNALLLLARADAGEGAIQREAIDLAALACDVVELFEPLAEERGIRLVAEGTGLLMVAGDASRLRQLVTNLVDNAVRFTGPGGNVTLSVDGAPDWATLRVTDTGIGIPAERLPHIFERFSQADPARNGSGCGLGLSISRWIVKAHDGTIDVESREGEGTEFTVRLPLAAVEHLQPPAAIVGDL